MKTKRLLAPLLIALFVLGAFACKGSGTDNPPPPNATSAKWGLSSFNTFAVDAPPDQGGSNDILQLQASENGMGSFAIVRIDLGTEWFASELVDARLFLKMQSGSALPQGLKVSMVNGGWDSYFTPRTEVEALIPGNGTSVQVKSEADGWISIPVMDQVKTWLVADLQNNGIALQSERQGELYSFETQEENAPYILASGVVGNRQLGYAKFPYKRMASVSDSFIIGNCLSYSLRDENPIELEHLGTNATELAGVYAQGGVDALADYTGQLVVQYVQSNAQGLEISEFRLLDGFGSSIDPTREYRIALRVGVRDLDGEVDFENPSAFDFHWWLQLDDGRWAQKFPLGESQIVPCTGPGISAGKFPWNSSYYWTPKSRDFYTSKVVYFAVTKDTDEFTKHPR